VENYFNYFTEIEERYQQCRGTRTLLSPLDWALIESWKEAQLPLAAVLAGIERAFQKYRKRARSLSRRINSLAYCAQEVLHAAEEAQAAAAQGGVSPSPQAAEASPPSPFSPEEIRDFLRRNGELVERARRRAVEQGQQVLGDDLSSAAGALRDIAAQESGKPAANLEELEGRLAALEEKLTASLTRASSLELLTDFRNEVERSLVPYRRKMSAPQIDSLQRQFLKKRLLEYYEIPRLSLFYL
jgi:hypothetical protein